MCGTMTRHEAVMEDTSLALGIFHFTTGLMATGGLTGEDVSKMNIFRNEIFPEGHIFVAFNFTRGPGFDPIELVLSFILITRDQ